MNGTTVIVTGGDAEPGASIVRTLADAGARLVVGGRDPEDLDSLADSLDASSLTRLRTDVRDEFDVERLVETAAREGGSVDLVVPAATVRHGPAGTTPLQAESYAAFDDTLRTNCRGVFATVTESVPHLAAQGRVLIPVDVAPGESRAGGGAFAVSQAATVALARGFAADLSHPVAAVGGQDADPTSLARTVRWAAGAADPAAIDGRLLTADDRDIDD